MTEALTNQARQFLRQYEDFLEADTKSEAKAPLASIRKLLDRNVTISYSGQPGLVSSAYGSFQGKAKGTRAMLDLRKEIKTNNFKTQEFVNTSFKVDLTNQANPLTPISNKIAVIAEQNSKARKTDKNFRLDNVIYFESNSAGKISNINFSSDSHLMSEALSGRKRQVPNPDIDDVINNKRDKTITAEETLAASLNFFGAFGSVSTIKDLDNLTNFLQPNAAVKFGGDPRILPFADTKIRKGSKAVVRTFKDQLRDSAPRLFDIEEIYIKGDRFIANTFEARTAVESGRNYDIPVNILFTASLSNGGRVNSIEGIFDSTITTTAFTGKFPFPNTPV